MAPLRVALGEYDTGWHDPDTSLDRAASLIARGAALAARLVVLPEMCTTGFTMDVADQAEPLDGPHVRRLGELARGSGVWLLAGVSERRADPPDAATGANAAVLFDPDGEIATVYRKQRLFAYGGEDAAYAPGSEPVIAEIDGVRVSPFICYDLRFPELFRAVAGEVDALLLIANWPAARRAHWDVLVRARAIENLAYMVAVNRTGEGGGLAYDGGSVAYDPWGERLTGDGDASSPAVVEIDPMRVSRIRAKYPFLRDYRQVTPHPPALDYAPGR